jgi:hypothetical protein
MFSLPEREEWLLVYSHDGGCRKTWIDRQRVDQGPYDMCTLATHRKGYNLLLQMMAILKALIMEIFEDAYP